MRIQMDHDSRYPELILLSEGESGVEVDVPEAVVDRFRAAQREYDEASAALEVYYDRARKK